MSDQQYHIRWMIRRDMEEVLEIENASFDYPWLEDDFFRCLRQRNCIGMVATETVSSESAVLGFMIYELNKNILHVLDFAVSPDDRRRGIGRQLSEKLKSKLSQQRRTSISLEVSEENLIGQQFFRSQGFVATGVLYDFYEKQGIDAYRFVFNLNTNAVESKNRISGRVAGS